MRPMTTPKRDLYNRDVKDNTETNLVQAASNGRLRRAKKLIARKLLRKTSVEVKL